MNIVITGANKGIGLALTKKFLNEKHSVYACCRKSSEELRSLEGVTLVEGLDVSDESSFEKIKSSLKNEKIDLLIQNAGIYLKETAKESFQKQFEVNSTAPMRLSLELKEKMNSPSKIAIITSRMGSIADNTSGGSYGYRMSKAAINAGGYALALDLKSENIAVALIHPGYVQTDMTSNSGHISTTESAAGIFEQISKLNIENTGTFLHSNGEKLPW